MPCRSHQHWSGGIGKQCMRQGKRLSDLGLVGLNIIVLSIRMVLGPGVILSRGIVTQVAGA